ncbi:MAG TPA: alkaline phosphatase family protein [Kofleriaceae bacterium]|nr:alkaline phosphatase family protein [Kofleriaceae bacterium]
MSTRWIAAVLVALLACKGSPEAPASAPAAEPTPAPPRPGLRLVVLLVIDQLPSWSFERDMQHVSSGIARLRDGGVLYPRARFPFANTYTATGHAALGTGAPPSITGILGNAHYDRAAGVERSTVLDEDAPLLAILPRATTDPADGASSRHLRVDGVADVLAAEHPAARSVSIALKDRGAILSLGRRPNLAVWYDPAQPAMTTSRFYAAEPPPWLLELARTHPVTRYVDTVWEPLDAARLAAITGTADDAPGESSVDGLNTTFPHALVGARRAKTFRATPMADELLVATALAAIDGERLGADDVPDLLSVSFSAHDYAGHFWGQESWERLDLFLRLDRSIGTLLDGLDHKVGKGRYAVVLSSDHGSTRMIEHSVDAGRTAVRVFDEQLVERGEAAARTVLGKGSWIAAYSESNLYMTPAFAARAETDRDRALDAIAAGLRQIPGVAFAGRTDELRGDCETRTALEASICRSLGEASGEVFVAAAADSLICEARYVTGTSHGSPNPDDTDVPIIIYAPGLTPQVIDEVVSPLRIAPTLAALLGISAPPASRALPLP